MLCTESVAIFTLNNEVTLLCLFRQHIFVIFVTIGTKGACGWHDVIVLLLLGGGGCPDGAWLLVPAITDLAGSTSTENRPSRDRVAHADFNN